MVLKKSHCRRCGKELTYPATLCGDCAVILYPEIKGAYKKK